MREGGGNRARKTLQKEREARETGREVRERERGRRKRYGEMQMITVTSGDI